MITKAPWAGHRPGRAGGGFSCCTTVSLRSSDFIACSNQDVVYGLGYLNLDNKPAVIQVPDFGDRFWVYAAYDQRSDQFGEFGQATGTKPGFYLLVGPTGDGEVPEGITGVARSSTAFGNIVPRILMNDADADRAAIQPLPNQVVAYSLGTKNADLVKNEDGSLTIYVSRVQPGASRRPTGCRHPRATSRSTSGPTGARRPSSTSPGSRPPSKTAT